jgi:hypothetical protein
MAYQEKSKFCKRCGRHVLARRQVTSELTWLIFILLTCGIGIIFWILCKILTIGGWRCSVCGKKV